MRMLAVIGCPRSAASKTTSSAATIEARHGEPRMTLAFEKSGNEMTQTDKMLSRTRRRASAS